MAHAQKEPPHARRRASRPRSTRCSRARSRSSPAIATRSALELAAAFRTAAAWSTSRPRCRACPRTLRARRHSRARRSRSRRRSRALEAARNPHQARDARVAARARRGAAGRGDRARRARARRRPRASDLRTTDAVRRLRRRALPDAEWLALGRELVLPFTTLRDAHPIPELVDFLDRLGRDAARPSCSRCATPPTAAPATRRCASCSPRRSRSSRAARRARRSSPTTRWSCRATAGARAVDGRAAQRSARWSRCAAARSPTGQPALVDATALPVVTLWPFVQVHEPARGVGAAPGVPRGHGPARRAPDRAARVVRARGRRRCGRCSARSRDDASDRDARRRRPARFPASPRSPPTTRRGSSAASARSRRSSTDCARSRCSRSSARRARARARSCRPASCPPARRLGDRRRCGPGAAPLVSLAAPRREARLDPAMLRAELAARPGSLGAHAARARQGHGRARRRSARGAVHAVRRRGRARAVRRGAGRAPRARPTIRCASC